MSRDILCMEGLLQLSMMLFTMQWIIRKSANLGWLVNRIHRSRLPFCLPEWRQDLHSKGEQLSIVRHLYSAAVLHIEAVRKGEARCSAPDYQSMIRIRHTVLKAKTTLMHMPWAK